MHIQSFTIPIFAVFLFCIYLEPALYFSQKNFQVEFWIKRKFFKRRPRIFTSLCYSHFTITNFSHSVMKTICSHRQAAKVGDVQIQFQKLVYLVLVLTNMNRRNPLQPWWIRKRCIFFSILIVHLFLNLAQLYFICDF